MAQFTLLTTLNCSNFWLPLMKKGHSLSPVRCPYRLHLQPWERKRLTLKNYILPRTFFYKSAHIHTHNIVKSKPIIYLSSCFLKARYGKSAELSSHLYLYTSPPHDWFVLIRFPVLEICDQNDSGGKETGSSYLKVEVTNRQLKNTN